MKKIFTAIFLILCAFAVVAQNPSELSLTERVYISTDRDYYIAGEPVWISAFNFNPSSKTGLSDFSSMVYIELHSASSMVHTAKIAMNKGRGCGRMMLPSNLPTGNYVMIAYTAQNANEKDYDYSMNAKKISVFNTFSSSRLENGVNIVEDNDYSYDFIPDSGDRLTLSASKSAEPGSEFSFVVGNARETPCDFSISIFHESGLTHPQDGTIEDVCLDEAKGFELVKIPEYEGEIITAKVVGSQSEAAVGKTAYIASPSEKASFYMAEIGQDGYVSFYTNNIFGDKDVVLQINQPQEVDAHLEMVSPFVNPDVCSADTLRLSRSLKEILLSMSASMQIARKFDADTLYELLPIREDLLFKQAVVKYHLDDYKRFPTIEEDVIEFIPELRVRRDGYGRRSFDVRLINSLGEGYFDEGSPLVMIDGVPVLDHELVLAFNPLLVEDINIYTKPFLMGEDFINGYVDFVTYKKDMGAFNFPSNVRMFSFNGASQPLAYTCQNVSSNENYPDYRQTVYWYPMVKLAPGEKEEIRCCLPDYTGRFLVKIEGFSEGGVPFAQTFHFDVKR